MEGFAGRQLNPRPGPFGGGTIRAGRRCQPEIGVWQGSRRRETLLQLPGNQAPPGSVIRDGALPRPSFPPLHGFETLRVWPRMTLRVCSEKPVGVLVSGGLDSAILLGWLLDQGCVVQPFYVQSHLYWQPAERTALAKYLASFDNARLRPIVEIEQSLADLYTGHWSLTGQNIPSDRSPDEAVFLPGRNALLVLKAALWCQLHDIDQLALATLVSNPFADASNEFFQALQTCLNLSHSQQVVLLRPFATFDKAHVMELGDGFPLELTFSCIAPQGLLHCGACNKCAERQAAFQLVARPDQTRYASALA